VLDHGRPPGTAVACIQHAATPRRRIIRRTLAELAANGANLKVENRAVIVIGPTAPILTAAVGLVSPAKEAMGLTP
jgi:siroheme synthase